MIVDVQSRLAFRLLAQLSPASGGNVCFSPLNLTGALACLFEGAAGATRSAMEGALGLPPSLPGLLGSEAAALTSRLERADEGTELRQALLLLAAEGFAIDPLFLERSGRHPDLRLEVGSAGAGARINAFVKEKTRGRIDRVMGDDDRIGALAVVTALYFRGAWKRPFERKNTMQGVFRRPDGPTACAMMMGNAVSSSSGELCSVVRLPYAGERLAWYGLLPARGLGVPELLAALSPTSWEKLVAGLVRSPTSVILPRLTLDCAVDLVAPLSRLGMGEAFDANRADFSGLGKLPGAANLCVDRVLHRAMLELDEEGTVAAAATVASTRAGGRQSVIAFDRPFVSAIRDEESGALLLLGVVNAPQPGKPVEPVARAAEAWSALRRMLGVEG